MDLERITLWSTAGAALLAIGTFLITFFTKRILPWLCLKITMLLGLRPVHKKLAALEARLDEISKEFKPNDGESLRDTLNRIERFTELAVERQRMRDADSTTMFWEADAKGNFIYVNRTLARSFRRVPGELLGSNWINTVHPKDRERVTHAWSDAVESQREVELEWAMLSGDSPRVEIPVRIKSYLMSGHQKEVLGYYGIMKKVEEI